MSRDFRKLRVWALADAAVVETYRITKTLPPSERFGLQSQIRRAAVSVVTTIVEGSARRTTAEYLSFLNTSSGSAAETAYLLGLCVRLGFVALAAAAPVIADYHAISGMLQRIIQALEPTESRPPAKCQPLRPEPSRLEPTMPCVLSPEP